MNIIVDHNPSPSDNDIIKEGLIKTYEARFGDRDKPFSIFLKDSQGKVCGGLQAFMDKESIYIEALWIPDSLQNRKFGSKLLHTAEQEAIKNGCLYALVDTWDFQAEPFYLKNGYERIAEIPRYWRNHSKLFLRKKLS